MIEGRSPRPLWSHLPGKEPMGTLQGEPTSEIQNQGLWERRFQAITPWTLTYDEPFMEHPGKVYTYKGLMIFHEGLTSLRERSFPVWPGEDQALIILAQYVEEAQEGVQALEDEEALEDAAVQEGEVMVVVDRIIRPSRQIVKLGGKNGGSLMTIVMLKWKFLDPTPPMNPPLLQGGQAQGRGHQGNRRWTFRRGNSLPNMTGGERRNESPEYKNDQQERCPSKDHQWQEQGHPIPGVEGIDIGPLQKLLVTT